MEIITDLHIHSRYARATSNQLNIPNLEKWARVKGLNLLGTGDFTHPEWLKELKENLKEEDGVLKTESGFNFILQGELSNIYSQGGKLRKIHNVVLVPSFEIAEQVNEWLSNYGKLASDGRPIFGSMSCIELVEGLKNISDKVEIIPAHAWTPWFGVFGSSSGFDSIEECFKDQSKHIFALETGLSSNPAMNWRLSALDKYTLISNSDSHSFWPWRLGREANILNLKNITYNEVIKSIREGKVSTIEVDPAYGKYHYDGHRNCNVSLSPKEALKLNNVCPVCGKPLTLGVEHRVEELADRPEGFRPKNKPDFKTLIPLSELIAHAIGVNQLYSKKIFEEYNKLVDKFGSEYNVLLNISLKELVGVTSPKIAELIIKNRNKELEVIPGYDGEYGVIKGSEDKPKSTFKPTKRQDSLNNYF